MRKQETTQEWLARERLRDKKPNSARNPRWTPQPGFRGPEHEWRQARLDALNRDGWKCTRCPQTKNLHVHHKTSPSEGQPWDNRLSNLQVLCRSCHGKESGAIARKLRRLAK